MFELRFSAKDCPKKKQNLSGVENPTQSSLTGETTLSDFHLTSHEKRTMLNNFESKSSTFLVTGIDSGAARSVVPVGKTPGYIVVRDSTGEKTYFKLRNCVWELETTVIPKVLWP